MSKTSIIAKQLQEKGFVVLSNFLDEDDISSDMSVWLEGAPKFKDGVVGSIPTNFMGKIQSKIANLIPGLAQNIGIEIDADIYIYSAIRLNRSQGEPALRLPFHYHLDPKIAPGGVLNWHLDHFSYYLGGDHTNYLICYLPVQKPDIHSCNLAIIPYDILKKLDSCTFMRVQHRGALRFRCVESDTMAWFQMRFPNELVEVGQWYAIDDFYPSPGWKLDIDIEQHKVVPQLSVGDLLIMRADVIHRTEDAKTDRISIRCDAIPRNARWLYSWFSLFKMGLMLPFEYPKVRYNKKIWLKAVLANRLRASKLGHYFLSRPQ
ncbi:hypothetical protein [Polynucleobacter sp. AP-Feld-500C-C5]|uniref:hypothetical protein n=1 Tax=Polynucleobacter sp. AP-Feld-500C-C5 TaxID=2576924 RepID=UPI001C0D2799|nr:hypothetical protein [Polynucleobacter sp. AP-Feld-500C-C5]MBU3633156.1 hypothetical protein [Polynucleobacter sp. AP-Feld-500C-C5]